MKKLINFVLISLVLFFGVSVWAAGSVSQTMTKEGGNDYLLTFSWTGDASDGSVPATASVKAIAGYVYMIVTNPGATAPTDDYDITLTDSDGIDIMGGELVDRDTADTEAAVPKIDTVYGTRRVNGVLTLNITNNTDVSATGTVVVYFYR